MFLKKIFHIFLDMPDNHHLYFILDYFIKVIFHVGIGDGSVWILFLGISLIHIAIWYVFEGFVIIGLSVLLPKILIHAIFLLQVKKDVVATFKHNWFDFSAP